MYSESNDYSIWIKHSLIRGIFICLDLRLRDAWLGRRGWRDLFEESTPDKGSTYHLTPSNNEWTNKLATDTKKMYRLGYFEISWHFQRYPGHIPLLGYFLPFTPITPNIVKWFWNTFQESHRYYTISPSSFSQICMTLEYQSTSVIITQDEVFR